MEEEDWDQVFWSRGGGLRCKMAEEVEGEFILCFNDKYAKFSFIS